MVSLTYINIFFCSMFMMQYFSSNGNQLSSTSPIYLKFLGDRKHLFSHVKVTLYINISIHGRVISRGMITKKPIFSALTLSYYSFMLLCCCCGGLNAIWQSVLSPTEKLLLLCFKCWHLTKRQVIIIIYENVWMFLMGKYCVDDRICKQLIKLVSLYFSAK